MRVHFVFVLVQLNHKEDYVQKLANELDRINNCFSNKSKEVTTNYNNNNNNN